MARARFEEIRDRYRVCAEEHKDPLLIAAMVAEQVGLCDSNGDLYLREDEAPTLAEKPARRPTDFRLDVLAEAIIGRDWKQVLGLERRDTPFPFLEYRRQAMREGRVREESAAPVGPSVWGNVAAWSATVGVLAGAQFNLGYQSAAYDMADLYPIMPAYFWQGGERIIDVIGPYQPARKTGPGEEYPDANMGAMWVEPGPVEKYAGKLLLTKEMLEIDVSGGQFLAQANMAGDTLKYRENELALDVTTGQTNNFKLGFLKDTSATGYNTYGPTITTPDGVARTLTNDNVNPLNDVGALQKSDEYLANLYHPFTDQPLEVTLDVALFPTPMAKWAGAINATSQLQLLTQTTINQAQPAPGAFPTAALTTNNPWNGTVTARVSRRLHDRHVRSTTQGDPNLTAGLGLTGPAVYRWYRLNPAKLARRRQKWAATSTNLSPNDYVMATQGIAAGLAYDIATMVQVLSPYHIQRHKAA